MRPRLRIGTTPLLAVLLVGCAGGLASTQPRATAPPAAPQPARANDTAPRTMLVGTLVDTHCYSMDPKYVADDHKTANGTIERCAQACATMGIPVALLTATGEAVVLLVPAPDLADHMGREARVFGARVLGGSVRPDSLFVRDDRDAWTPVAFHQMM